MSWRSQVEEPSSFLSGATLMGVVPHCRLPASVCDILPQWHPLPGWLWPHRVTSAHRPPSQASFCQHAGGPAQSGQTPR